VPEVATRPCPTPPASVASSHSPIPLGPPTQCFGGFMYVLFFFCSSVPPDSEPRRTVATQQPMVKGLTSGRNGYHFTKAQNDMARCLACGTRAGEGVSRLAGAERAMPRACDVRRPWAVCFRLPT